MDIVDQRQAPTPFYAAWLAPLLNDPRDAAFVGLSVQCLMFAAIGVSLFFVPSLELWMMLLYWAGLFGLLIDRFTLMLHCTSHRQLYKPKYRLLNELIPVLLAPFFGQTPNTYFAHHMGMHHAEENLEGDLSSTMRFQRDRFAHWLIYWSRFLFTGLYELTLYMARNNRKRLFRRVLVGELGFWIAFALLCWINPAATLTVFGFPLLAMRTLMMMGNWAQHAFIDADRPENAYNASITCINSRYNRRCFNDGYHIGHHLQARAHWTEYPIEFESNIAKYVENRAIVFQNTDFFMVWVMLMTGSWSRLARAYVQLPGAPPLSEAEIIALLKERVKPFASRAGVQEIGAPAGAPS